MGKRSYGFDLITLPDQSTTPATWLRKVLVALREADREAEFTVVAASDFGRLHGEALRSLPGTKLILLPLPDNRAARIYAQQVLLPAILKWRGVKLVQSLGLTVPALFLGRKVLTLHSARGLEAWKVLSGLMSADVATVETPSEGEALKKKLPRARARLEVVSPGVGDEFRPLPREATKEVLDRHGIKGRFFVQLGRIDARSKLFVTLEAFAKLARRPRFKSMNLVLAGPERNRSPVDRRIEDLGLSHRVQILGYLPANDLPHVFSAASFMVYPGTQKDFPLAMVEAMACSCPVVAPTEELYDSRLSEAVLRCHPDDPKALAEAMTRAAADEAYRDSLVAAGIAAAKAYSWDNVAKSLIHIYDELLAADEKTPSASSDQRSAFG